MASHHLGLAAAASANCRKRRRSEERTDASPSCRKKPRREEESETDASLTANLDLVREILLRLPATSVARFERVCKEWRDIATDPSFVAAYARRRPRGVLAHHISVSGGYYAYSCSTLDGSRLFPEPWLSSEGQRLVFEGCILDTCNGLLVETVRGDMSVYNPATMQRRILPACPLPEHLHYEVVLAFEPWRSTNYRVLVVGYDTVTMYSSETDSWQTLSGLESLTSLPCDSGHCYCNGVVHWCNSDGLVVSADIDKLTTTAFHDDNDEKCYYIHCCGEPNGGRLRVLRTNVDPTRALPLDYLMDGAPVLQVLELASDSSRWLPLHTVQFKDLYRGISKLDWNSFSWSITRTCCLVGDDVVLAVENKIVAYDLRSRTLRELCTTTTTRDPRYGTFEPTMITLVAP